MFDDVRTAETEAAEVLRRVGVSDAVSLQRPSTGSCADGEGEEGIDCSFEWTAALTYLGEE